MNRILALVAFVVFVGFLAILGKEVPSPGFAGGHWADTPFGRLRFLAIQLGQGSVMSPLVQAWWRDRKRFFCTLPIVLRGKASIAT